MATDSPHAAAAKSAADHLDAAKADLRGAYDHPHHTPRLDHIGALAAGLRAQIEGLPQAEAQRADYAGQLMTAYRNRQLPPVMPSHAEELLAQELQRAGN